MMIAKGSWIICLAMVVSTTAEAWCQSAAFRRGTVRSQASSTPGYRPAHEKLQPQAFAAVDHVDSEVIVDDAVAMVGYADEIGSESAWETGGPESLMAGDSDGCSGDGCDACSTNGLGACGGCEACGRLPRFWGGAELLVWWTDGLNTSPLVSTSAGTFSRETAGVLGQPGTSILFGERALHDDMRTGGRYRLGMWIDDWNLTGVEGSYLSLQDDTESFLGDNTTFPVLARPFLNVRPSVTGPSEDASLIAFPGDVAGNLFVRSVTEFQAYEVNIRRVRSQVADRTMEWLAGYRGANLDETVAFASLTTGLAGVTQGATFDLRESFATKNQFHGGQVGFRWHKGAGQPMSLEILGKVALGNTRSKVAISGTTTTTAADQSTIVTQAGLLAQGTNIRSLETDELSTISELGVTLRRHLPLDLTLSMGYSFIYWSDVLRGGELIDRRINTTQIPPGTLVGDPLPQLSLNTTSFWAQGLSFGLEYLF